MVYPNDGFSNNNNNNNNNNNKKPKHVASVVQQKDNLFADRRCVD
jgi:hypothetical protein